MHVSELGEDRRMEKTPSNARAVSTGIHLPRNSTTLLALTCCCLGIALCLCSAEVWRSPVIMVVSSAASGYTQLFALLGILFSIAFDPHLSKRGRAVISLVSAALMSVSLFAMLLGPAAESSPLLMVLQQVWAFFGYVLMANWMRVLFCSGRGFLLLAFAGAFVVSAFVRTMVNLLLASALPVFAATMPVLSALLMLPVIRLQGNRAVLLSESHGLSTDVAHDHASQTRFILVSVAVFCICSGLLLKSFHELWLPFQKEEGAAFQIQLYSAIGSLLAALAVYLVIRLPRKSEAVLFCETFLMAQLLLGYAFQSLGNGQAVLLGNATVNAAQCLVVFLLFLTARLFESMDKRMRVFLWLLFFFRLFPSVDMIALFVPNGAWGPRIGNAQMAIALVIMTAANLALMMKTLSAPSQRGAVANDGPVLGDGVAIAEVAGAGAVREAQDAADLSNSSSEEVLAVLARDKKLTMREREILPDLVRGLNARQIGERLCISEATAKTHIRNIYLKLEVHSRIEMIDLLNSRKDEG